MATPPEVAITRLCISGRTVAGICVMMLSHCGVSPTHWMRARLLLGSSFTEFHLRGKQLVKQQCCTTLVACCCHLMHLDFGADMALQHCTAFCLCVCCQPIGCLVGSVLTFCACFMFLFVFSFVLAGELFITHTCNKRNHKRQTESLLQPKLQVTLTTWKETNTKACRKSACQAKTSQAHVSCSLGQSIACPLSKAQTMFRSIQQRHNKFLRPKMHQGCKLQNRHARHN